MSGVITFALLGLGSGGLYALLSLGVVLVYRGSGVVNFAAGAFALFGASVYYECSRHMAGGWSLLVCVVATAIVGLLVQLLIMGPMRRSSPLARVVATLAILSVIEEGGVLRYGTGTTFVTSLLPTHTVKILGADIGEEYLWILGITLVALVVLTLVYGRTRFGLLTSAVADNDVIAASQGSSPSLIAAANWALGGGLAGLSGGLLVPIIGLNATSLPLIIVIALAAALVGSFSSFWLTALAALLIGVIQSEMDRYVTAVGWSDAVPFIVIVVFLVVRGRALPLRSHLTERLPRLGRGHLSPPKLVAALVIVGITMELFTPSWSAAVTTSATYALLCLSLVVVTGLCGQLSLAQFALAGIGALVAGRLAAVYDVPFLVALLAALVVSIPVGLIVALPAVRVRGINLAVLTMGVGEVIADVVLGNPAYTGGAIRGTVVHPPELFGYSINSVTHPERYAWVCLAALVIAGLMVSNVRRGRSGRRMISVRDNERAAASLGVSVVGAKLYAFALASALAAAGGVLMAFLSTYITFGQYSVLGSINLVLISVLGGIGHVAGAPVGGIAASGGTAQQILTHFFTLGNWFLFATAAIVLVNLVVLPDGLVVAMALQWRGLVNLGRKAGRRLVPRAAAGRNGEAVGGAVPSEWRAEATSVATGGSLCLEKVTVRFGGVVALEGVSLRVDPGEVVGLIGPNGAGKTTLVDVATGYVRPAAGAVKLGDHVMTTWSATRRARHGLSRSFQSLELFEDLTVADNLRVAADRRDRLAYLTDLVHPSRPPLYPVTMAVIDEFELTPQLELTPDRLSYAERHLVAIARTVATSPSVLLLDEPAAGLDETSTRELGELIRRLASGWGIGVLVIEHNVPLVLGTCDRVVALDFGRVIAQGTPDEVRNDPAVIAAYLGGDALSKDQPGGLISAQGAM